MTDSSWWRSTLGHHFRLRAPVSARYEYRSQTCGPSSFATVELAFEPCESFRFARECEWPSHVSDAERVGLDAALAAGVHDALQPAGDGPYAADGVSVSCIAVEWDDAGSSEVAFYIAAWRATRDAREKGAWELEEKS
jgi:hypothetical protein